MKYNGKEYYSQGDVYAAIEKENKKLKAELKVMQRYENIELEVAGKRIAELEEENKYLKSEIRRITSQRDNLKGIADNLVDENRYLEGENNKLKDELDFYKKQYEHSMGEE